MQTGGLIRDPERRRSLVDSTVAAIEAKLDMLRCTSMVAAAPLHASSPAD